MVHNPFGKNLVTMTQINSKQCKQMEHIAWLAHNKELDKLASSETKARVDCFFAKRHVNMVLQCTEFRRFGRTERNYLRGMVHVQPISGHMCECTKRNIRCGCVRIFDENVYIIIMHMAIDAINMRLWQKEHGPKRPDNQKCVANKCPYMAVIWWNRNSGRSQFMHGSYLFAAHW